MSDAAFIVCGAVICILFAGDPNLMDAIITYLNNSGCKP